MYWQTNRTIAVALVLYAGAMGGLGMGSSKPAFAAATGIFENKLLADTIAEAQAEAAAGRYTVALAKAKAADAIMPKPAEITRAVHNMVLSYALSAKDYDAALTEIDKMLAANEGNKVDNLKQAVAICIQAKNKVKFKEYADQLAAALKNGLL